jgi:hypothetical protein
MSLLRGCVSLQAGASRSVAYMILSRWDLREGFAGMNALRAWQSVYASIVLFPHPSASRSASGFLLLTRCLPRFSYGLANTTATLGSFYWLGFETTGLSPDKKRLAWLGAQRVGHPRREWKPEFKEERYPPLDGATSLCLSIVMRPSFSRQRSATPCLLLMNCRISSRANFKVTSRLGE